MQKGLFVQITEGPHTFLLASEEAVAIEHRDRLNAGSGGDTVVASYSSRGEHWPAVSLARVLGFEAGVWSKAVFIKNSETTLGFTAEQVQLLRDPVPMKIRPFTMIGGRSGDRSLYRGVSIEEDKSTLIFDGGGLTRLIKAAMDR